MHRAVTGLTMIGIARIAVIFLVLGPQAFGQGTATASALPLSTRDFQIIYGTDSGKERAVYLDQPIGDVVRLLGDPLSKSIELIQPPSEGDWDVIRYEYPGIEVGIMRAWPTVDFVKVVSKNCKTPRGIRVGMSKEDVLRIYGEPKARSKAALVYSLDIPSPGSPTGIETYLISFDLASDRIQAVWIKVAGE